MTQSEIAELEMKIKLLRDGIASQKNIVKISMNSYQAVLAANQMLR